MGKPLKIRSKIAIALLLVTLIPLASFAIAVLVFNQAQVERIGTVAQWQAQAALDATNRDLDRAVAEVRSWTSAPGIAATAAAAAKQTRTDLESRWRDNAYIYSNEAELLKRFRVLSDTRFAEIFFTDQRGFVIASTNPTSDFGQGPEDDPPGGEIWWQKAHENGLHVGQLEFDKSVGLYSIAISLALIYQDQFVGVLKAVYSVESILEIIGQANIGRAGHTVLVGREGNILAAPQRFRTIIFNPEASVKPTRAFAMIEAGTPGYSFDTLSWVGRALVGVAPDRGSYSRWIAWSVLLIVPVDDALIPARQVQLFGLAALGIVLVVVLLISVILSRRMSKPLVEISEVVAGIEGGNFGVDVPYTDGQDEIAHLARSINSMTDRLESYDALNIGKIQELNRELELANEQLTQFATYDSLTGLNNVRVFREKLEQESERAKRSKSSLSLLLLDIDHFKQVNDVHGHPAGDAVLRQMGELLRETARSNDYPARYGGEELVVLLPDTDAKEAMKTAERLRKLISVEIFDIEHEESLEITVSIGCATADSIQGYDAQSLVDRADKALYRAKAAGRNRSDAD